MKKIKYLILILFGFYSCDSFLEVKPTGEIVNDKLFETAEGFEEALYVSYSFLAREPLYGQNLSYYIMDIAGQYFYNDWSSHWSRHLCTYDYKHMDVRPKLDTVWTTMYKGISYVNNILGNLSKKDSTTFRLYDLYKGEALGLRAFMHFELLRLYAESYLKAPNTRGIPYYEKYSYEVAPFETVKDAYEKVIRDFKEAERLLAKHGEYFDRNDEQAGGFVLDRVIHMNLYAVQALLARVYWEMGDLEKAKDYALSVINCGFFKLEEKTDVEDIMNGVISNKETIWGIYSEEFPTFTRRTMYASGGDYSLDVKSGYEDIYNEDKEGFDYRQDKWFQVLGDYEATGLRCMKIVDRYKVKQASRPVAKLSGLNMIRLPELHYIVAEYYLRMDDQDNATKYFDPVLRSRGLNGFAGREGMKLNLKHINNERRKELVCEGQWFFMMKHYEMTAYDNITDQTFQPSSAIYVWPIPDSEFEYRD